jgi:hypothetical protein
VNPSVLGGIIVDFGDKTIDLSVQSRVTKLNNVLQRMSLIFSLSHLLTYLAMYDTRISLDPSVDYSACVS